MRLTLSKARKNLKTTGLNSSAETKFRTVIKGKNNFQISSGKLSIPTLDAGEYDLEVFAIEDGNEPELLTKFEFEVLESDINSSPEIEEIKNIPVSLDPKDKIIEFLEKQISSMEKNFQDRLERELTANSQRFQAELKQKDFELKLERDNQRRLDEEREKISNRVERNLRQETKYKGKSNGFESFMPLLEKLIPFILPSGDSELKNNALAKAAEMLASMETE